jgi:hypothetical protein
MDAIQIQPASFDQLVRAKDGRLVGISDDVGGVAQQLREIDPGFRLAYSEAEDITIVSHDDGDSEELSSPPRAPRTTGSSSGPVRSPLPATTSWPISKRPTGLPRRPVTTLPGEGRGRRRTARPCAEERPARREPGVSEWLAR